MIRAVFFDIDGTLVSFKTHDIPESTIKALSLLKEKGIKIFIATGRHKSLVKFLEEKFDFDGFITLNGQYCFSRDNVIYKRSIDKKDIKIVIEQAKNNLYACNFVNDEGMFGNMVNERVEEICSHVNIDIPDICDPKKALESDIYQMLAYLREDEEYILMDNVENLDSARWHPNFIDVVPKGGSKSVGIEQMLKHYDIKIEETMAFGDGGNDIDMLKFVQIGVAMGNAVDVAKEVADYITDSVDDDGIMNALKHFNVI